MHGPYQSLGQGEKRMGHITRRLATLFCCKLQFMVSLDSFLFSWGICLDDISLKEVIYFKETNLRAAFACPPSLVQRQHQLSFRRKEVF